MVSAAPDRCPECHGRDLVTDFGQGDVVCRGCGFVCVTHLIDERGEWNSYANDDQKEELHRVGWTSHADLLVDPLSTEIAETGKSSKADSGLRKIHHKATSSRRLGLMKHFSTIQHVVERLSMPDAVAREAIEIFSSLSEKMNFKAKDMEAVLAACVFIAGRKLSLSRTLKEIAAVSGVSKREIGKQFLSLSKHVEVPVQQVSSVDFMSRLCSSLRLTPEIQKAAEHVASRASDVVAGKSPDTVAAAAIYLVLSLPLPPLVEQKRTCAEVSEASHVAEGTIKSTYKQMLGARDKLIPDSYLQKMLLLGYSLDTISSA